MIKKVTTYYLLPPFLFNFHCLHEMGCSKSDNAFFTLITHIYAP